MYLSLCCTKYQITADGEKVKNCNVNICIMYSR